MQKELVKQIRVLHKAVQEVRSGPLNDRALMLLLQDAVKDWSTTNYGKIPLRTLKAVFEGIESMEELFLRDGIKEPNDE